MTRIRWVLTVACSTGKEKAIEKNKKVYMAFVDLEKAYGNVNRGKPWKALEDYGVEGDLLRAIQAVYEGGKACVKVGQSETEMFDVQKGVRQDCTLSPWLFNVFVDEVVKEARRESMSEAVHQGCGSTDICR